MSTSTIPQKQIVRQIKQLVKQLDRHYTQLLLIWLVSYVSTSLSAILITWLREDYSLEEIGKRVGVSRQAIGQLLSSQEER